MTQDEIIEMAKQARFYVEDNEAYSPSNQVDHELTEHLEAFAKLVAQRTWVGLTEEDLREFAAAQYSWEDLLIAAEAKLKAKNT